MSSIMDHVPGGLELATPIDHAEDLPEDAQNGVMCWVGPDIWQMSKLTEPYESEPEEVEWKGKPLKMQDWGCWRRIDGKWFKVVARLESQNREGQKTTYAFETERCFVCKRPSDMRCVWIEGRQFYVMNDGWYVTDSYPPGDDGLYFFCSLECVEKGAKQLDSGP